MTEQDDRQTSIPPYLFITDSGLKTSWELQGQPWRTETEIDQKRQQFLAERRRIIPDIPKGIYPFRAPDLDEKNPCIKLNRADIEWLLATHENSRGPINWEDKSQRKRQGLDLRGANLSGEDLHDLPLACTKGGLADPHWDDVTDDTQWNIAKKEKESMAGVCMQEANLLGAQLQGANLSGANLTRAGFVGAQLQEAALKRANLTGAFLTGAKLQGADLWEAQLQGADLRGAQSDGVNLEKATLSDEQYGTVLLADIRWGDVNLAVVDWTSVKKLGDEQLARRTKSDDSYRDAVRANHQLAVALRNQGLNEEADRFDYRAQVLQRKVYWNQITWSPGQLVQSLGKWLFSAILAAFTGYGYKPQRCFSWYIIFLLFFTLLHMMVGARVGHPQTFPNALAVSIQSLHGRIFSFQSSDPQTWLNTAEAFVGLFIEAIVVAVIIHRILGK